MKNYDERIESIFRKYDEKLEAKRRKSALVRRTAFSLSGICATAIVGIFVLKMPHKTDIPNPGLILPQESTTSVTEDSSVANTTVPVTTSVRVDTTKTTASTNSNSTTAKKAETTVRSTVITAKTSSVTSSKTTAQTSISGMQSTETTINVPPQTEQITTDQTKTTSINQTTTAATTGERTSKTGTTTTAIYTHNTTTNDGQITTTTTIIMKPDERIILAIENTYFSRSVSEFKNGEKYKYTGNYMKLTDISDYEYVGSFKVYYYFGPIKDEMSSVYKVYTVPDEEDKAAVQIDNSDFFLFFEKCIQE